MGYDRIAYFSGNNNESTLLSADNKSGWTVYGKDFKFFCMNLGYKVRTVVDTADAFRHKTEINRGAHIDDLPERTRVEIIPGRRLAEGIFVELKPPPDEAMTQVLNAYFQSHCDPSDAGLILDYRAEKPKVIGGF